MAIGVIEECYPFLAVSEPTTAKYLVVEGWVHDYAMRAGIDEFNKGGYVKIFATGGPVTGMGGYTNDWNTAASVGAGRLKALGATPAAVQMVPSRESDSDRTYFSAIALADWCRNNGIDMGGVNVVTEDVHARRTRLLFQKALGEGVRVGIIAARNPDYSPDRWWRYSEGVRNVLGEMIAYVYAKLFFCPFH